MKDLDLSVEDDCNRLLDAVWSQYFDTAAIDLALKKKKHTQYNLMLRLGDFATVMEAHEATRAGDIGRLMNMWKRWAIMAQGVPGPTHYARHIPRIVMLLEEDLPETLAHALKHSMLIPSNDRDDHWLPLDEYQEVHICWLKDVYDNTVSHRTERGNASFSICNKYRTALFLIILPSHFTGAWNRH